MRSPKSDFKSKNYFQFLAKNFNIFKFHIIRKSLSTIYHIENIVQENMIVSRGYMTRGKNSFAFVQKWLILKVVKITWQGHISFQLKTIIKKVNKIKYRISNKTAYIQNIRFLTIFHFQNIVQENICSKKSKTCNR